MHKFIGAGQIIHEVKRDDTGPVDGQRAHVLDIRPSSHATDALRDRRTLRWHAKLVPGGLGTVRVKWATDAPLPAIVAHDVAHSDRESAYHHAHRPQKGWVDACIGQPSAD